MIHKSKIPLRKTVIRLLVWGLLAVVLGAGLAAYRGLYSEGGLRGLIRPDIRLSQVSKMISDRSDHVYVISDSKQTLTKLDSGGTLLYRLYAEKRKEELVVFNNAAADTQGRLYVTVGVLETSGIHYLREEVWRYTSDGSPDTTWKTHVIPIDEDKNGDGRAGRSRPVKGIIVENNEPYVYVVQEEALKLIRLDAAGRQEVKGSVPLPSGRIVAHAAGNARGSGYFLTKRGELYAFDAKGARLLRDVFAGGTAEPGAFSFPDQLKTDDAGRKAFFIAGYGQEVREWDPDRSVPEAVVFQKSDLGGVIGQEDRLEDFVFIGGSRITVSAGSTLTLSAGSKLYQVKEQGAGHAFHYAAGTQIKRWLYWLAAGLAVIAMLLFLKTLYLDFVPRSLIYKQIFLFAPIILMAGSILAYFVYSPLKERILAVKREDLINLARHGEHVVNLEAFGRIQSPADFRNPDYEELRAGLMHRDGLAQFYHAIHRYESGRYYTLLDDDTDNLHMFEPLDTQEDWCYKRDERQNWVRAEYSEIAGGEFLSCSTTDNSGTWVYGIGPLYDKDGKFVGAYETGINGYAIDRLLSSVLIQLLEIIAGMFALLLAAFVGLSLSVLISIRRLSDRIMAVGHKDWGARVELPSLSPYRDEVNNLGRRFNLMAGMIEKQIIELQRTKEAGERFVPKPIHLFLKKEQVIDVRLGDREEKAMCLMSTHLHSFFKEAQRRSPRPDYFGLINRFLQRMCPVVRQANDGESDVRRHNFVVQYMDAGFLALFPEDPRQALDSALRMCQELESLNEDLEAAAPLSMGIGLHFGPVMLCIGGEEKRLEAMAISDHVNLAHAVQQLTAELGTRILVTDALVKETGGLQGLEHRYLGTACIAGQEHPVSLIDVFEGDPEELRRLKRATKSAFDEAVMLFQHGQFDNARALFLEIIKKNGGDLPARRYFFLCEKYLRNAEAAAEWNGSLIA
ncbi:class 3 adenylate cyclase [Paenibacillus mucilaginosus]|uniref:hypothetical protein n=1 Tax=Paenibacillus mucilaginosus TaxID=61624 RepID=UPI003D20FC44